MTMGDQWSFKPDDNYKSTHRLIQLLVDIVAKGGNFLLNVGPRPNGALPTEAVERLNEIGDWMSLNGQAIYNTRPVAPYKDGQVAFTRRGKTVYAIYIVDSDSGALPDEISFTGPKPAQGSMVYMLGVPAPMSWETDANGQTNIKIPPDVRQAPPCGHAVVFRFGLER